jgi:NDP-sugar pyrophosphorylase family protein
LPKKGMSVHPTAIVEEGAEIGDGTKIWHHVHIRHGAKLGKNCVLGKGVYVGEGVKIGDNVKIENYVSVFKGVTVEESVFIGPHVTFTNDLNQGSNGSKSGEWQEGGNYTQIIKTGFLDRSWSRKPKPLFVVVASHDVHSIYDFLQLRLIQLRMNR